MDGDGSTPTTVDGTQERRADRDHGLVEALRLHEPTAAERLVATYGDRAYRLATGITGNAQDAEEVVQDVFWTAVRKIDTFRGESTFGSWLYRIVANAAYQKVRGRRSTNCPPTIGPRCCCATSRACRTSRWPKS